MQQRDKHCRSVFHTVALSTLLREAVQLVPEGVWLELKPEAPSQLRLSVYQLSSKYQAKGDLQLEFCHEHDLSAEPSFLLRPSQFFRLGGNANGIAEFSTIPNLYFNKKFNSNNGLGQPHSEVAYFKAYYSCLHPEFGLRPLQVLDLGCGRGRNAVIFANDCVQDYQVLGLDQNAESLAAWNGMAEDQGIKGKLVAKQVDLNTWREAPAHDIAMAIVSLQFLHAAAGLLCHCMEQATRGALHLAVFPIASQHPSVIWPGGFRFLPQRAELKHLYMQWGWSILEYRENYGHLGKVAEDGLPIRGQFATLIAQKI